jgi:hypothetical protein
MIGKHCVLIPERNAFLYGNPLHFSAAGSARIHFYTHEAKL